MECFEIPKLPVFCDVGIHGLAQKRLEVHDANFPIVERQTNLVTRDIFRLRDFQIVCRSRFHFSFRVMSSGLLCFLNTKYSIQRRTISSALALTSVLKSFILFPGNGRLPLTFENTIRTILPSFKKISAFAWPF